MPLLCHRYLLAKAEIMTSDLDEGRKKFYGCLMSLEKLKLVFEWEVQVVLLVPPAVLLYYLDIDKGAYLIGGAACVLIMATDILFSVMV